MLTELGVPVLLSLLTAAWVAWSIRSWFRLRHIPGPPLAHFSAAWMLRKIQTGRFNEELVWVSEKFGPLVRIGPNDLLCTDPDTIRRMSSVRSPYVKGDFYETGRVVPGYENIVSERDVTKHKALRAALGSGYLGRDTGGIVGIEESIDRQLKSFIRLIESKYVSAGETLKPLELSTRSQFFALDVISDVSFGTSFGFLVEDKDLYNYIEITDSAIPMMSLLQAFPRITNVLYSWPLRLALPSTGDKVGFGRLMGLAKLQVDQRLGPNPKPGNDMLQAFVDSGLSYDQLVQHMFVQIIAGSVTTAAAIRHTILALVSSPTAYSTLQREIDEAAASGKISSPITEAEAQRLPYLQAVIREGLRLWPPAAGLGSKQVPPGGDVICGYQVPGSTQVGHNFAGVMQLKSVWGEDAAVFRPERWIEAVEDQEKAMNSVVELAFGSGRYQCLGRTIAKMELNKIFVELFRRFDFGLMNPQRPIKSSAGTFWVGSDMWVRVTRRTSE